MIVNATASRGLEVAVANLQEYYNGESFDEIMNRLMPDPNGSNKLCMKWNSC